MYEAKVPYGFTYKLPVQLDGVSPVDYKTPFSTDDFDLYAYIKLPSGDVTLQVEKDDDDDTLLYVIFDQLIYKSLDPSLILATAHTLNIYCNPHTATTSTTIEEQTQYDGVKDYLLASLSVTFNPTR